MGPLYVAISLFGMAALFGMYMLSLILTDKSAPRAAVITHGFFASLALIVLLVYITVHPPGPWASLTVFVLAAIGGLTMVYRFVIGKTVPKWLAIGHGLTAIVGFALLLLFAFA
ncbi:MAG: hypothetical protein IPL92_01375 [Saprospiraceae bacterium]|nr:hypothetical protein [Candidatus Opimibacter iunctus]